MSEKRAILSDTGGGLMCGCGNPKTLTPAELAAKTATDTRRTNALLCRSCDHYDAGWCYASLAPVEITHERCQIGLGCPKGFHQTVNSGGIVKRWGLRWYGVPMPLRWRLEDRGVKLTAPVPGCGCLVGVKRLAERLGLGEWAERVAGVIGGELRSLLLRF